MENGMEKIACKGCGSVEKSFFCKKNNFSYYKCSNCGTISLYKVPDNYSDIYNSEYFKGGGGGYGYVSYDEDKKPMKSGFLKYLKIIENISSKKGRLFDVGAATGFFMNLAKEEGFDVSGVEISDYAAGLGRSRGLDIKTGTLEEVVFEEGFYDVVSMLDVIEHMPLPENGLRIANKMLRKDGLLVINTPDSGSLWARIIGRNWHLLVAPEHIHLFNKESISRILNREGFEVVVCRHIGKKFTVEYILIMFFKWFKMDFFKVLAHKLKGTYIGKIALPTDWYDNMFVVARKK